ncbi:hypothetical protein [Helicobacter vulpis]|uniref:hypothetical protein n=1 Tax=Helicobacter vulpis TaxID=2316076 RepID=UPI0013CDE39E|nr:hypothetical protein [Helicobacter vulpis]
MSEACVVKSRMRLPSLLEKRGYNFSEYFEGGFYFYIRYVPCVKLEDELRALDLVHTLVCQDFQARVFYLHHRHQQSEDYMIKTMLKDRTMCPFKA